MTLGEQIVEARKAKQWSQEELARKVGVTKQAVIWWEADENVPRKDKLKRLEAILDSRLSVTGSAEPHIPDVPAKVVQLAMAISRLTKPQHDAVDMLIKAFGNSKK